MTHQLTRRDLLVAPLAFAALQGCAHVRAPITSRVSITRAPAYSQTLYDSIRRILREHAVNVAGKRVVVKPNLVEFDANTCINTHPLVVHALLEALKSMGAADVIVAEGPGHRRTTMDLAEGAGYFETVPNFESKFVDLNLDDVSRQTIHRPNSKLSELYLPNTVLGADLLISVPKLKTHHWVGATLSMKNLFGVVPGGVYGWPKNVLHWAGIEDCIMDLHGMFPRAFALVDGIMGMEGNGPIQGTPRHSGVLVAGSDLRAVDATCCQLMGIDPTKIGYLSRSHPIHAEQIGEPIAALRQNFALLPQFQAIRLS